MRKRILKRYRKYLSLTFLVAFITLLSGCQNGILDPKGVIANDQRTMFFDALALMLIVVLPVIIMSFAFAFKYRQSRSRDKDYSPTWSHNSLLELLWWGIPTIIIIILGVMVWKQSHKLDPYRSLDVKGKPIVIQAIALRWQWLFIYPKQNIATLNYVYMPMKRPVEFHITADAPMSSFIIPQLGGQIYAMAGMRTRLHLYSSYSGVYEGLNSQYNGYGFSDMHFKAHVVTQNNFKNWVLKVKNDKSNHLGLSEYKLLQKPSIADGEEAFSSVMPNLFKSVMMVYMKNKPLN